jgi:hypothetical protein
MSLLYIDGFDQYDDSDEIVLGYSPWVHGEQTIPLDSGNIGTSYARGEDGKGLYLNGTFGQYFPQFCWNNPNPGASLVMGFAFKYVQGITGSGRIIGFSANNFTDHHFQIRIQPDLYLALQTYTSGLDASDTPVDISTVKVNPDIWYYMEVRATINDSTGNVTVRLFGEEVLSYNGDVKHDDSTDSFIHFVGIGIPYKSNTYYDDFYFCDFQGSVNNTFLGDVYIRSYSPDADGSANDFTSSDDPVVTTRYTQVDEGIPHDGDGTYIDAEDDGDQQLFDFPNAASLGDIGGVMSVTYAKKDGAGSIGLRHICKSGTTTETGDPDSLTSEYIPSWKIFDTDPDTGAAWTTSGVNSAEFGVEVEKA